MEREKLPESVKQAILEIEPGAEVTLFGSRSRGDFTPDSDWDFLVLLDGPVDESRMDRLRHRLYEIEWEHGAVISALIWNKQEWDEAPFSFMTVHNKIAHEGIRL